MNKKVLRIFGLASFSVSAILQIGMFLISVGLIFAAAYIVGFRYLEGNTFWGNDAFSYYTVIQWFSRYFPHIPFWFPLEGGGVSPVAGYPYLAAYIVILVTKISTLNLPQSMRLIGFLTVPLTGVGIFLYAWSRLTTVWPVWMRQVLGLIAALFYVVSPVAWVWLIKWGFFSEQVSHIFVPITMIFFDLFIDRLFENKKDFWYRVGFVGTAFFLTIALLVHFFAGYALIPLFLIVGLVRFIFAKENRIVLFKRLFFPILGLGILSAGLFWFRLDPYLSYNESVAVGGFRGYGPGDRQGMFNNTLTAKMMLSLEDPEKVITESRNTIINMRFPTYVWVLVLVGLVFSVFKSKGVFAMGIYSIIGFLLSTNVDVKMFITKIPIAATILAMMQDRGYFIAGGLAITITAAFGAYVVWELASSLVINFLKKIKVLYYMFYPVKVIFVLVMTLVTVGLAVQRFYSLPRSEPYFVNVGSFDGQLDLRDIWLRMPETHLDSRDTMGQKQYTEFLQKNQEYLWIADYIRLNELCTSPEFLLPTYSPGHICNFIKEHVGDKKISFPPLDTLKQTQARCFEINKDHYIGEDVVCKSFYRPLVEQLQPQNWKIVNISGDISGEVGGVSEMFKGLPTDGKEYRFDLSGFAGRQIMLTPLVNSNSGIQVYINTLSLIYNAWNYQSQVMYTQFPLYQKPGVLTELAKWFGIDYVRLTGSKSEPLEYWKTDPNWRETDGWQEFTQPTGLATWDNRPRILIISNNAKDFYDQTLRFFTWGGLPYEMGIPIMGEKEVDKYSLSELKKFDMIFMRGYGYKSKNRAYKLLDNYVKSGGKLIFDTGWQYYIPDYQIETAPAFMPFEGLVWKNLPPNFNFQIEDPRFSDAVGNNKIGDLKWENTSWGVSIPTKMRSWAKSLLKYDGRTLMAVGKYGKGQVAWFGFNIVPHAEAKNALGEVYLFRELIRYMNSGFIKPDNYNISYMRVNPDKIEFEFKQDLLTVSSLYFRESYYPSWHAELISPSGSKSVPIYRAGPGFKLMYLPPVKSGDKIVLEVRKPLKEFLVQMVSVISGFLLIVFLIIPGVYKKIWDTALKSSMVERFVTSQKNRISHKAKKLTQNDDIDY